MYTPYLGAPKAVCIWHFLVLVLISVGMRVWMPGVTSWGTDICPHTPLPHAHARVASAVFSPMCFYWRMCAKMALVLDQEKFLPLSLSLEDALRGELRRATTRTTKNVIRADRLLVSCMFKALAPASTHVLGNTEENVSVKYIFLDQGL